MSKYMYEENRKSTPKFHVVRESWGFCYECCLEAELKQEMISEKQYLQELDRIQRIEK